MENMTKKAQATLFIIAGILILLIVSLAVYYREVILQEPELLQPEYQPVKNYIEGCIADIGEEAVELLGSQSGYIEIPNEIELEKSYISLTPLGLFKIPYWDYKGKSRIPSTELMQNQISDYVVENIDFCLNNFEPFQNQFEIKPQNDLKITTTIAEKEVIIEAEQLIRVKNLAKDESIHLRNYRSELPVRLKLMYDLGRRILQEENRKLFLENITVDLFSLSPNIPITGLSFGCKTQKWRLSEIKTEIQNLIYYQFPNIRIENTAYPSFEEEKSVYEELGKFDIEDIAAGNIPSNTPSDAYDYFHYLIDVKTKPTDLKVGFSFQPEYGLNVNARPSNNGILESDTSRAPDQLKFMCINFHHFTYDVEFPVMVTIRDDEAFNQRGYIFNFMIPVVVKSNQGNKVDFGQDVFEDIKSFPALEECNQLSGPVYDIRVNGVEDGIRTDLKDVNLTYDCIQASCTLGKTKLDSGAYRLQTQLPTFCSSGFLVASKSGYLDSRQQVLDSTDITVDISKLKEFSVSAKKHIVSGDVIRDAEEIPKNHRAIISIQSFDNPDLLSYAQYPEEDATLNLIEDNSKYSVDILYVDELDNVILGGYKADWEVNFEEMQGKDSIVFHVAELKRPLNESQTYDIIQFLEENQNYKASLKPEFK